MVTETNQAYFAKVADCLVQEGVHGKGGCEEHLQRVKLVYVDKY